MTRLDDIVDIFELLGDWEQRYQYLTELGEKLPAMPAALKTEANKVRGCMSEVWVCARHDEHDTENVRFYGDCDTSIIKGVLAVLIQLASDREERRLLDVGGIFPGVGAGAVHLERKQDRPAVELQRLVMRGEVAVHHLQSKIQLLGAHPFPFDPVGNEVKIEIHVLQMFKAEGAIRQQPVQLSTFRVG